MNVRGPVGWATVVALLEDLEQLGDTHGELYDTDVREHLWAVIEQGVIKGHSSFTVPTELGMFSAEANAELAEILRVNVNRLNETFATFELTSEQQRLASFFNSKLHTERGSTVEDFFGSP